jgi:hypothetical protein
MDIKILKKDFCHFLDPGEQVEANEGYVGHPSKIKCPQNVGNPVEPRAMQERVRARHETLNGRLKIGGFSPRSIATTSCGTEMCSKHVR